MDRNPWLGKMMQGRHNQYINKWGKNKQSLTNVYNHYYKRKSLKSVVSKNKLETK